MSDKVTKYDYPSTQTGGVKPLSIRGFSEDERFRLSEEFTDEERKWRKQWIKDQKLSENEPRPVSKEWEKEVRNPFRRMLSKPWQLLEDKMTPVLGKTIASNFRYMVPKFMVGTAVFYLSWYHLKYNQNDWTKAYGATMFISKPVILPGEKGFPAKRDRFEPSDYDDRGFKSRKVFLDI